MLLVQVHQDKCFAPSELVAVQYHVTVFDRSASSDGLPILGMLRAHLTSDNLAVPALYEVPVASTNTALKVNNQGPADDASQSHSSPVTLVMNACVYLSRCMHSLLLMINHLELPCASRDECMHSSVQFDIDFEKPLAEAVALAASRKQDQQQQQQQMRHSQQMRETQPSRVTSNEELESAISQAGFPRPSSQCIADETPLAGIPAASSSAVRSLSPLQQANTDIPETHYRVSELVAGCLRRVMSTDFRQALLQCQAGRQAVFSVPFNC